MGPFKVLLVDDTISIHAYTKFIVEKQSKGLFHMEGLYSAEDMLAKLDEIKPDVILLDISLPKMNGIDACAELKKTHDIPVIIVTAELNPDTVMKKTLSGGANDFLIKPYTADVLIARMSLVLGLTNLEPSASHTAFGGLNA